LRLARVILALYNSNVNKQTGILIGILFFLFSATLAVIFYGKGYRFNFDQGKPEFSGTGLLVATSNPDGAGVFINNHLTNATNSTINLTPAEYTVKISKEGYFPWEKKIKIQKEVVSKVDALLIPKAPKLENITTIGVSNPILDPSQTKLAYTVASQTLKKNGIYILDLSNRPILTLQSASTQISDDTIADFSTSSLSWSPDGNEILATTSAKSTYLLKTNSFNQTPQDVTATLSSIDTAWNKDIAEKKKSLISGLNKDLQKVIAENFEILSWSLDETKILYQASESGTIPLVIKPRLLGIEATPEQREIRKGETYAYDIKEDKNYKLDIENLPAGRQGLIFGSGNYQGPQPLVWFPDSKHLILVHNKKIELMDYDGTNITTIYAGPFVDNYVFPWPNGSKIIILTNLGNPDIAPNLYTIGLK